ncbi:MAG: hypothetical protein COA42_17785 [Alteromonadaceae bacterium]|nr:MAG: hypothetical protein COA42_17785 [Alteromonadaceae bacterium]
MVFSGDNLLGIKTNRGAAALMSAAAGTKDSLADGFFVRCVNDVVRYQELALSAFVAFKLIAK